MTTLYLVPGNTFSYTVAITDKAGDMYSLVGSSLWFTVKRRISDALADVANSWTDVGDTDGITIALPATGVAVINIEPDVTEMFRQAAYSWSLVLRDATDVVRTVDEGTMVVLPSVLAPMPLLPA